MKKILWIGDGPDCPSGFGRVTRQIVDALDYRLHGPYDVTVLGINHRGDPGSVPYPVFTAYAGGDFLGINRLIWMCDLIKPDLIVAQNDPWNIPGYTGQLKQFEEHAKIPVIGAVAVDGKNCAGAEMNDLALAIFWTQFGLDAARLGGYAGPAQVIPLGVDLNTYHPMDKYEARLRMGLPSSLDDTFIVGNVNRNQPRKRWDLTLQYFAEWVHDSKVADARLFLHVAPTGETSINVKRLAKYYHVLDRILLVQPPTFYGVSEEAMCDTYNCFDVQITTTQGEGFGLTTLEGMACGIPQIVPDWSALGDWAKGAVWLVPCPTTAVGPPYVNVIGGIPDKHLFIRALNALYRNPEIRAQNGRAALERASEARFRWEAIGEAWRQAIASTLASLAPRLSAAEPARVM